MRTFLLKTHAFFYQLNDLHSYKTSNKLLWLITNVGARFFELLLGLWIWIIRDKFIVSHKKNPDLVVSLTTFPARLSTVWMTIDSIFRQKMQPFKVVLTLSEVDFPGKEKELPQQLLKYERLGLEIIWMRDNLCPHKKYFISFQKYKDKYIVTVDDDIYYRNEMLQKLWTKHLEFPNMVIGNACSAILDANGRERKYQEWSSSEVLENTPSHNYLAIGWAGVLYPPALFSNTLYNIEAINKMCLSTDDLWLKANEIISDIQVVKNDYICPSPTIVGTRSSALFSSNVLGKNDNAWDRLKKEYNLILQIRRSLYAE